ncbi:PadR family transcriptional regulator [Ekhidna sp. To15]|uniref:PadR family transcriptional regulator n=1 Tax=Ekhidna sp. To15 TaxID=3395267 RepID=UPI003F51E98F
MKGTHLGEFQEIVMLSILILEKNAYGVTIQAEIDRRMKRAISRGALHTALTRLEEKGFISSDYGEPTSERGGRRKRFYEVTNKGLETLQEAKGLREGMWGLIPKLT